MKKPTKKDVDEFLSRGVREVIDEKRLRKALLSGRPLRVYLGIDPTAPELHIGHAIVLHKMRQLQDWGNHVILLIGDFTALIGDPTGKDKTRPPLTTEQILDNAKDYKDQAARILDFDGENPIEVKYNSTWLAKLNFADIIELAANFTVQQMLERDMFQRRMKENKPISMHEFLYPLMQGYDSVAMDIDLELGGSDQLFNMLAGRTLKQKIRGEEKHIMSVSLLLGSDGRKMSKSYNNHIPIAADAIDMYGRVMSIKDELIGQYFWLATKLDPKEVDKIELGLKSGDNPRDVKMSLARELVTMYHSEKDARKAEQAFVDQFQKGGKPKNMKKIKAPKKMALVDLLIKAELATSKSDARRLIEQGSVRLNDKVIKDRELELKVSKGDILQKGKRGFVKFI